MADTQWLNDLKAKIIDPKDANNFDDLIKCYENGLLRAGFLMAWVMLIESFKRKIVDLDGKGVKVASEQLTIINKVEGEMRSNDEAIKAGAVACDLISKEEEAVLDMLWKKRCIMSHPYMPDVKESDFRYMVENLISMSLGRSLMWSHSMIDGFFAEIHDNVFLIPDVFEAREQYADNILAVIPANNQSYFWKTLFYQYSINIKEGHRKYKSLLRLIARKFVKLQDVDINDTTFTISQQIKNYCPICWRIFGEVETWKHLNDEYKGQMFRFIKDNWKEAQPCWLYAKNIIKGVSGLDANFIDCYYESLDHYIITDVEQYYIDKDKFLNILYDEKIKGWQFSDQGDFIDMLTSMSEDSKQEYTPKQLETIGKYVAKCCYNGTYKAQDLVRYNNGDWISWKDYVRGFIIESFTRDDGSLYLFEKCMEYAFVMFKLIGKDQRIPLINELQELVVRKQCEVDYECASIREYIERQYADSTEEGKLFKEILNKYCKF